MNYATAIHARLAVDGTLLAQLPGGVLTYRDNVPPEGMNRDNTPQIYDAAGLLQAFAVVRGRTGVPLAVMRDPEAQFTPLRHVVEIYFYDDGAAGWNGIEAAAERVYALLQERAVAGSFNVTLFNEIDDEREPALGNACMLRRDYEVIGRKEVT